MTDTPTPDPAEALARELAEVWRTGPELPHPRVGSGFLAIARYVLAHYVPIGAVKCGDGHDVSVATQWGTACPFCIVDERNSEITGLRQKIAILCGYDRPIAEQDDAVPWQTEPGPELLDYARAKIEKHHVFERTLRVVREGEPSGEFLHQPEDVYQRRRIDAHQTTLRHLDRRILSLEHAVQGGLGDYGNQILELQSKVDTLARALADMGGTVAQHELTLQCMNAPDELRAQVAKLQAVDSLRSPGGLQVLNEATRSTFGEKFAEVDAKLEVLRQRADNMVQLVGELERRLSALEPKP